MHPSAGLRDFARDDNHVLSVLLKSSDFLIAFKCKPQEYFPRVLLRIPSDCRRANVCLQEYPRSQIIVSKL